MQRPSTPTYLSVYQLVQGDQKVSLHLIITLKKQARIV
jgi:hypothetical protein